MTSHNTEPRNFIFLNYHSVAASTLHFNLANHRFQLNTITFDSSVVKKATLDRLPALKNVTLLDSTTVWQSHLSIDCNQGKNILEFIDSNQLQKAIEFAKLKLLTWLSHRENFGRGLNEMQANYVVNTTLSNALLLLDVARPYLIVSLLAPSTPFDICITALAQYLGIVTAGLGEINLCGVYYLTFNQFAHGNYIASFPDIRTSNSGHIAAKHYLRTFKDESPYYINHNLFKTNTTIEQDKAALITQAKKAEMRSKDLASKQNLGSISYTSIELQRIGFVAGRHLKHHFPSQATKERMRASYLETMASNLSEIGKDPSLLILLDYYPEITRYPIGGDDYFYANYFALAELVKSMSLFNLSDSSHIYVKEHPAMLEPSNHSHPRQGLTGLMKNYQAKFVSPLSKTTDILRNNPHLVVITGVSNAGLEASLLGHVTLTTSKPWWLFMPNTYYFNIYTRQIESSWSTSNEKLQSINIAECAFESFIAEHCIDLGIPIAEIDTSFSTPSDLLSSGLVKVANAIGSEVTNKC